MKILVVEDDFLYRELIYRTLLKEGYDVTLAGEGEEALKSIGSKKFDIMVTDILMPNKEGLELIHEVRQAREDIKIIAISASGYVGRSSYLQMAEAFGANDSLKKPFTPVQLVEKIAALVARS